ncbi:MAG: tetraacyldisaccharide 4'-kinase [Flavobacteriales bacterium]
MVKLLRYILFPLSLIYGCLVAFRNFLFNKKILKSSEFDVKTIQVGNLSAGGTGKTPHIEYLIRLLKNDFKIETLSRGYGRKTHGFQKADENSTAKDIGDEPLQFYSKFNEISVNVDAKRVDGVIEIMSQDSPPEVILLDDAFQHRAIKSGFSILLTDYNSPFYKDFMLPTGNLREFPVGKKRADLIVVTKSPDDLIEKSQEKIISKINTPDIPVFFSKINYGNVVSLWDNNPIRLQDFEEIILVTGIANPTPLVGYLKQFELKCNHIKYPDHHPFTEKNITEIISKFEQINSNKKLILTTEKDAMRLKSHEELKRYPMFYIDIEIQIIGKQKEFNKLILDYVRAN